MEESKGLGDRLRNIRQILGLSQRAIAEQVGVSQGAWVSWELERTSPSGNTLMAVCAMGFNGHWLLTGEGEARGGGARGGPISPGGRSTEEALQADELEQLRRYGLTEVFLLARRGNQAALWRLMQIMNLDPARGFTLPELVEAMADESPAPDLRDVAADCRLLTMRGVLTEERRAGEIFYQLRPDARLIVEDDVDQLSWMREAIRVLIADILPSSMQKGTPGFGALIKQGVPSGTARETLRKIRVALTSILNEAGEGPEQIQMFIGATFDSEYSKG